jgi:hypothetical protein
MSGLRRTALTLLIAGGVAAAVIPATAQADPDTDFGNQLHTYGIYGAKDYNAWIGKLTCRRIGNLDPDAYASAKFVAMQLPKGSTTAQAWQFLGGAINTYCPEQLPVLQAAAVPQT